MPIWELLTFPGKRLTHLLPIHETIGLLRESDLSLEITLPKFNFWGFYIANDELLISHAGQSQSYSFADSSLFEPSFVAFYADCYHEVKPLTAGYRLCLVYNLAITNRKKQPVLSQQMGPIEDINRAIQQWSQETHDNAILTYLLDHSYSEQNLSMANLKHGDFAKASVLLNAAANSGCQAYLCLATQASIVGSATWPP